MPTIKQALDAAAARFTSSDSARLDAQLLLCEVLACNTAHLVAWPDKPLDTETLDHYEQRVSRREQGEPIAYIRGEQEFWSRKFKVNRHTLIPRPETELLIETVLAKFDTAALDLTDLGTGSGAIAITLACEHPGWHISATDLSEAALDVARANAETLDAPHIHFVRSDWLDKITAPQDVIVSNPPYIAAADPHLSMGDVRFEPVSALVSGDDGLDDIHRICRQALPRLRAGGWLLVEHGYDQQAAVAEIFGQTGYLELEQYSDTAGQPRLTAGRRR